MAGWTSEEDAVIGRYAKTHSAAQIAAMLPGRSRAAVTGRAWRLGASLAKDEATRNELEHPNRRRAARGPPQLGPAARAAWPSAPAAAVRAAGAVTPRLVTLEALGAGQCRWPFGDLDIRFCGHPTRSGRSYCPGHHGLAYVPDPIGYDPESWATAIERSERRILTGRAAA